MNSWEDVAFLAVVGSIFGLIWVLRAVEKSRDTVDRIVGDENRRRRGGDDL